MNTLGGKMHYAIQHNATEWAYTSGKSYSDPYNDVQLDVVITRPDGSEQLVPAFWAGEQTWCVRYSSTQIGIHHFQTRCSDADNTDLHRQEGTVEVTPYEGNNPLLQHGPLQVDSNGRYLQHQDGTPFFWLGDTWWMGLCKRLKWPEDFQELTADRVAKGFSIIQIVAGLYPDMDPFDPRGANEAGFPWDEDYNSINPAYFDMADLRIAHLVRSGLVPCIVGCWGFYIDFAGADVLKKHWRYLIARYGAYPVVWCAAGEAVMPFYRSPKFNEMRAARSLTGDRNTWLDHSKRPMWSDIMRSIRAADPYHHPLTIHPTVFGHEQVDDPSTMDIHWIQTGSDGYSNLAPTVNMLEQALAADPKMPTIDSEVSYDSREGVCSPIIQRFTFWSCLLTGAAGHTYGAEGIWQVNTKEQPYGLSPHGMSWGDQPWDEAYKLSGSRQLGIGKRLLERYHWWEFESHPEWVEPHQTPEDRISCYAAGIPGKTRVIYIPFEALRLTPTQQMMMKGIEPGLSYQAYYFNPATGEEHGIGTVTGDDHGDCLLPKPLVLHDWVVVLER